MKVLIPNATSPKNLGDQAMTTVLINLVKTRYPQASITLHIVDPHLSTITVDKTKNTLYGWAVFDKRDFFSRSVRTMKLLLQYTSLRMGISHLFFDKTLSSLVTDYKEADLILFVGGGYLHSRKGFSQSLNLLMQLLLFKYASLFRAKKIAGPTSIGPFGYSWQEKIVVKELKKMDKAAIREDFSYSLLQKYNVQNSIKSTDHALLTPHISSRKPSSKQTIIGFTVRPWLQGERQSNLEQSVVIALQNFAESTGAKIQPIIQVDAPEYGEDDRVLTAKIVRNLLKHDLNVLPTKKLDTVDQALKTYANLDLLLGMRMHSNILAATQGVPFVAISYEYKTQGIADQLKMKKYCVPCDTVTPEALTYLLNDVYKNRKKIRQHLENTIHTISKREVKQWNNYLSL